MSKKYARDKTKYFKVISHGFAVGGLNELYNTCIGHDYSCDLFGLIKEKGKFDDSYYKVYKDLSKNRTKQAGIDIFNLKTLLNFDDLNYKDKLSGSLTCAVTSLFGAVSYDKLSENILTIGVAGGLINAVIKNIVTGHSHTGDFVFGLLASLVGVQIAKETKEIEVEDDILHLEIF